MLNEVAIVRIQKVEPGRRQVYGVNQLAQQHLPRAARIVRVESAELVQSKHAGALERDEPFADAA